MSPSAAPGRAAALREAFDGSFAEPFRPPAAAGERLLLVRAGGVPCALRLAQVAELRTRARIVPLPGASAGFLGLAGIRGAVVPVWDLGPAAGGGASEPRWLALAAGADILALAFDAFEGTVELPPGGLAAAGPGRPDLAGFHAAADGPRPVLDLGFIIHNIARAAADGPAREERDTT